MVTESEIITARLDDPSAFGGDAPVEVTIDGVPYDESLADSQAALIQDSPETRRNVGIVTRRSDVGVTQLQQESQVFTNGPMNEAQIDGIIIGAPQIVEEQFQSKLTGTPTVNDKLIDDLVASSFDDNQIDPILFDGLRSLDPEEQTTAILGEYARRNLKQLDTKYQMYLRAAYNGFGNSPAAAMDSVRRTLDANEIAVLSRETYKLHNKRAIEYASELGADFYVGESGAALTSMVLTEFTPLFPVAVRGMLSSIQIDVANLDIAGWRTVFPGEVQHEFTKTLLAMSPVERVQLMVDMNQAMRELKDGKLGAIFSTHLFVELFQNTMNPEQLLTDNADDAVSRIVENVAVLADAIWLGATLRRAGRSVRGLYRINNAMKARTAALAVGDHRTVAAIDEAMARAAGRYDLTPGEAAAVNYPRPPSMVDDRDILTSSTLKVLERGEALMPEILLRSNTILADGLRVADKDNAIRLFQAELEEATGMQRHTKMDIIEELENGAGVRITYVLGPDTKGGWKKIEDMVLEVAELDPSLANLKLMRKTADGVLEDMELTTDEFLRLLTKKEVPLRLQKAGDGAVLEGEEFFVQFKQDRFWQPVDKIGFGKGNINSTLHANVVAPNYVFSQEIYDPIARAVLADSSMRTLFNQIYQPYFKLSRQSKLKVSEYMEWGENFAQESGRAPMLRDYVDAFPEVTLAEKNALIAMRQGLDVQWSLFNRRLHRDMAARGLVTVRPANGIGAKYHGRKMTREEFSGGAGALDPKTGEITMLTRQDVKDLYDTGGGLMKTDIPVDVAAGGKAEKIIVRSGEYQYGKLSRQPMDYHPGYYPRFPKDPYLIIKESKSQTIDGRKINKPHEEAVATASTNPQGERWARNMTEASGDGSVYRAVAMADIERTLGSLYQQQILQREGRLFWDERNFDRLRNVNGNPADLQDPLLAIQRNMRLAVRQTTHEDIMKAYKTAFGVQWKNLVKQKDIQSRSTRDIVDELKKGAVNAVTKEQKQEYKEAAKMAGWLQMIDGLDETWTPAMRGMLNKFAVGFANWTETSRLTRNFDMTKFNRAVDNWTRRMDPFGSIRKQAFRAYLVSTPGRQLALQTSQLTYLTGLDPAYIATGRILSDVLFLKRGLNNARSVDGVMDGMSDAVAAKAMGLTKKEYKVIVKEFDRSGLVDSVSDHTFKGAANVKNARPLNQNPVRRVLGELKDSFFNKIEEFGFDFGETNNLAGSFLVAVRGYVRKNNLKSLTDISRDGWKFIQVDASNKALAMLKSNNFPYQSGAPAVTMQFLNFTHKAGLGYLGKNPAMKGHVAKVWIGGIFMWGTDILGSRDWVIENVRNMGGGAWLDREIPIEGLGELPGIHDNPKMVDILHASYMDWAINGMVDAMSGDENNSDLSLEFMTPGLNVKNIWEMQIANMLDNPIAGIAGPSSNLFHAGIDALDLLTKSIFVPDGIPAADKAGAIMSQLVADYYPGWNNVNMALLGAHTMQLHLRSGEKIPLANSWEKIIARGLFGARSEDELAYYDVRGVTSGGRDADDALPLAALTIPGLYDRDDAIKGLREHMRHIYVNYFEGKTSREASEAALVALSYMVEAFPEGERQALLRAAYLTKDDFDDKPTVAEIMSEHISTGRAQPNFEHMVDSFVDMPPEVKQRIIEYGRLATQKREDTGRDITENVRETKGQ